MPAPAYKIFKINLPDFKSEKVVTHLVRALSYKDALSILLGKNKI